MTNLPRFIWCIWVPIGHNGTYKQLVSVLMGLAGVVSVQKFL